MKTIKTISFEECQKLVSEIKSGQLYRIVLKKWKKCIDNPWAWDINSKEWIELKPDAMALIMDPIPTPTQEEWDQWYSWSFKALIDNRVCLVHVGWLEKMK